MNEPIDLLQTKIEQARAKLAPDTLSAIDRVDWKAAILGLRQSKGYSYEQLGDLEIETELLLCGILSPDEYHKEIETKLKLPKIQVNELINELNSVIFGRIREELVKIMESKGNTIKNSTRTTPIKAEPTEIKRSEEVILGKAGITINPPKLNTMELGSGLSQKFTAPTQTKVGTTEHTLGTNKPKSVDSLSIKSAKVDPYRELPE